MSTSPARAPRSDLWYTAVSVKAAPAVTLEAELPSLRFQGSADAARLAVARLTYSLSRKTALHASLAQIRKRGRLALSVSAGAPGSNPLPGAAKSALALGVRHAF